MGQQLQLLCDQFGRCVIAVLLVLGNVCFVRGDDTSYYWKSDLDALQAIYKAWNETPYQSSNLKGWSTTQRFPCQNMFQPDVTFPNWRGVQCLKHPVSEDSYNETSWAINVVGLELIGNPKLTGLLPIGLQTLRLTVLDVHDNGFSGTIPNWKDTWNLLQLDLSGNQFTGQYPFGQFNILHHLQVLSISNNSLEGPIPSNAFTNKTELETL